MIPFSPRKRERTRLETRTFAFEREARTKLEAAVCAYHGCRFAVAFGTPEAALSALLHTFGLTAGEAVVTGAMAPLYHYTAAAHLRAKLLYADISLDGNLNDRSLRETLLPGAKVLLSASFEGIRAEQTALPESVHFVEDLCASLAPASFAETALWSLEPLMPEGIEKSGFVLTNDDQTARRLRLFAVQGYRKGALWNYDLSAPGADTALGETAAAVALEQMETIREACERGRAAADTLDAALEPGPLFDLPKRAAADTLRSYPLLLAPALYCPKEDIFAAVIAKGVEAGVCCKPVYKTSAYHEALRLPTTEEFYKALLQLPCHHRLSTAESVAVAAALNEAVGTYAYRGCRF